MLASRSMTNTEIIVRERAAARQPLFKAEAFHFGVVEGALVLGFLAAFVALVVLLAK